MKGDGAVYGPQERHRPAIAELSSRGGLVESRIFLGREGGTVKKVRVAYEKSDCQNPCERDREKMFSKFPSLLRIGEVAYYFLCEESYRGQKVPGGP